MESMTSSVYYGEHDILCLLGRACNPLLIKENMAFSVY